MNLSLILLSISFISFIYFGICVFFLNPRSAKYRNFLYMCLAFALWNLGYILLHIKTETDIPLIYKIANISRFIYVPLCLKFFLVFTEYYKKIKFKFVFNIVIWLIPIFFIYNIIFNNVFSKFVFIGFWNLSIQIIFNIYNMICILIIFLWGRETKLKREKKQSNIILIGALLTIIVTILSDIISDLINFPVITPSLIVFWMYFILYAMIKYRFMSLTPAFISQDIVKNISEFIILIDNKKNIIYVNNKTKSLINNPDFKNIDLSDIIFEYSLIEKEIEKLLEDEFNNFSCRLNYIKNEKDRILIDAVFSIIKDKFNDILGILIIGYEVKGLKQIKFIYKITKKESEIIQELAAGYTNQNIAEHLGITENTLKRHIANIYSKFGIKNKVGLLNFLKDFNLIPNHKAERTLLLLNKK